MSEEPRLISAADLTRVAFSGVLAALKEHEIEPQKFPGPILVGIIAWPELTQLRGVAAEKIAPREVG